MKNAKNAPVKMLTQGNLWPFVLITSLFMLWGLANTFRYNLVLDLGIQFGVKVAQRTGPEGDARDHDSSGSQWV